MPGIGDVVSAASAGSSLAGPIMGGAQVAGGLFSAFANANQASKNRSFQDYMSSTSYQRAVLDLERAGLNPMLAYSQGGASTPAGSMASIHNPAEGASAAALAAAGLDKVKAETRNVNAEADRNEQIASIMKELGPSIVSGFQAVRSSANALGQGVGRVEQMVREALSKFPGMLSGSVDEIVNKLKGIFPSLPGIPEARMPAAIRDVVESVRQGSAIPAPGRRPAFGSGAYSNPWGKSPYEWAQEERHRRAAESPASKRRGGSR